MKPADAVKKMRSLGSPAVALGHAGQKKRGFSKFGGLPDLPAGLAWPYWHGRPLGFVAQLDLENMPASGAVRFMPVSGRLYIFFDQEQVVRGLSPGDRGAWRVLYSEGEPAVFRGPLPPGLDAGLITREVFLSGRSIVSFPGLDRAGISDAGLTEAEADALYDAAIDLVYEPFGDDPPHQLGGLPNPVLTDNMETEAQLASSGIDYAGFVEEEEAAPFMNGVADWRLLLQVASDDTAQLHWGDEGRLYFWIKKQDLVARNFERTWMLLQSF